MGPASTLGKSASMALQFKDTFSVFSKCIPPFLTVRMVTDLHRLVTFASPQERPLLIVGSGLGGLVARGFAHLHPQVFQPFLDDKFFIHPNPQTTGALIYTIFKDMFCLSSSQCCNAVPAFFE